MVFYPYEKLRNVKKGISEENVNIYETSYLKLDTSTVSKSRDATNLSKE